MNGSELIFETLVSGLNENCGYFTYKIVNLNHSPSIEIYFPILKSKHSGKKPRLRLEHKGSIYCYPQYIAILAENKTCPKRIDLNNPESLDQLYMIIQGIKDRQKW